MHMGDRHWKDLEERHDLVRLGFNHGGVTGANPPPRDTLADSLATDLGCAWSSYYSAWHIRLAGRFLQYDIISSRALVQVREWFGAMSPLAALLDAEESTVGDGGPLKRAICSETSALSNRAHLARLEGALFSSILELVLLWKEGQMYRGRSCSVVDSGVVAGGVYCKALLSSAVGTSTERAGSASSEGERVRSWRGFERFGS